MAASRGSALTVGDLVGSTYEVVDRIGAGGMGVVYKARDLKLERFVALKFLPPGLNASKLDKERFLKEARIASSLDHPNTGVIHGIEETDDGHTFIVMAYYEGQSLAHRIQDGPLPAAEVVDIAVQIARGLADAHSHNIIHRDIKPSNVMLTPNGMVKIVDFGLAHVSEATATLTHGTVGTLTYISPEQATGRTADQRSDIWALGVTLIEALTSNNPFQRDNMAATFMAILNEPPPPLENVPVEVQHVVYRCLSKDPDKRYQSCEELLQDLESAKTALIQAGMGLPSSSQKLSSQIKALRESRQEASRSAWPLPLPNKPRTIMTRVLVGIGVVVLLLASTLLLPSVRERMQGAILGPRLKHIAVLPFDNIGNNPQDQALTQGLVDSLSGRLSNLEVGKQTLWVIPSSEVRRLKVTDPSSALHELGATLVVKGTVTREGQQVRLNMDLIDTKDLRQIGSVALEDQAGDLATLQDEAVAKLARLMNVSVTAEMLQSTGGSVNPAAYENYLTALGYMQRYDKPGNLDLAIQALQDSVKTDPRFALGYAQLGEAYRMKNRLDHNPNWLVEAQANCKKAVEIDNRIPAAHVTLARIHDQMGHHDLALQEFQRALDINPRDATALEGLAHSYEASGRIADAEAGFQKQAALRPDSWDAYDELGNFYIRQGKFPQAIQQYQRALQLTPDNAQVYLNIGAAYLNEGDPKAQKNAEQALKKSIQLNPSYAAYANLANLYLTQERYAESAGLTENALKLNDRDYMVWNNLLLAYEWLQEKDKAETARRRMRELLEESVKVSPNDATAQATLAAVYAHYGLNAQAESRIQTALALAPDDAGVLSSVASAYELMGKRDQAIMEMRKAIEKGFALDQVKVDPEMSALIADPRFHQ
jgi:serine/threonine protein kinase/tetratricopeptide (TPR) repeat protein